jgi:hypothetical protein
MSTVGKGLRTVGRWWVSPVALARVAVLRAALYLFTIWDIFVLTHDVIGHGYSRELYQPTLIGRILPLPEPTPTGGYVMQWTLVVTCLATPVLMACAQRSCRPCPRHGSPTRPRPRPPGGRSAASRSPSS